MTIPQKKKTSEICMAELERCQRESQGYSYIFLGAQKYGFRPFPAKIPEAVFRLLREQLDSDSQALLDSCYLLDTNILVVPADMHSGLNEWHHGTPESSAGPVYMLRSSTDIKKEGKEWWPIFETLQKKLREASQGVWKDKMSTLRDPSSRAYIKKFFISVTEEEFSRGLLWVDGEHQRTQTLVFRRTIVDLAAHTANAEAKKFIDVQGSAEDLEAQTLLGEQLTMVPACVETIVYAPIEWGPGIDPTNSAHAAYLRQFLDDFCRKLTESIRSGAEKLAVKVDTVVDEATHHLRFALVRAKKFTSTQSTRKVENMAKAYLTTSSGEDGNASDSNALVIHGRSGAGKTYLLSNIMGATLSRGGTGVVVMRFLGTTPLSSNVLALLTSVCQQLRRVYGKEEEIPSDFKELRTYFHRAVTEWATEEKPLTLFIDSVDQLDDSNAGRRLDWLPVTGLPPYVKLVVSTLPDYPEFRCQSILHDKLGEEAAKHMVEVETISEHEQVLKHLLQLMGRRVTQEQLQYISKIFEERKDTDAAGTPLWLTIAAYAVSSWPSYDHVPSFVIKPAVRDLITDLFDRLVSAHGEQLVRAALAYITLTKNGVSETELNHVLSLEDGVLADVYEWWVPPVRIVPPLLVTRLLTDLAPYLTRRGDGSGAELVSWYHRQFWEAAQAWLFEGHEGIRELRHAELADYFSGAWSGKDKPYQDTLKKCVQRPEFFPGESGADRMVPHQPLELAGKLFGGAGAEACQINTRRVHELVHHLIEGGQEHCAVQELMSPGYIGAKFALGEGAELMREYAAAIQQFPDAAANLRRCKATVGVYLAALKCHPPLLALQMCFQQPDKHPLCVAAKQVLENVDTMETMEKVSVNTSHPDQGVDTVPAHRRPPYLVAWSNKRQEFEACELEIKEHTGAVSAVAYFPDGTRLASASDDGTIKIIDMVSGEVVLELQGHEGEVKSVAVCRYSKDGKDCVRLVSGGADKTVRVWDAKTGKCEQVMRGHGEAVTCVAVAPDGRSVVSGSQDETLRLWSLETGAAIGSPVTGHLSE
jgi:hypothetical protein